MRFALVLVTLLHFMPNSLWGQKVNISTKFDRPLYICKSYQLLISTTDISIKNIVLTTNNGEIHQYKDEFYFEPKKNTNATIYISRVKNHDTTLIDSTIFKTAYVPCYGIWVTRHVLDSMRKEWVCNATGIIASQDAYSHFRFSVRHYNLKVIRNNKTLLSKAVTGPRFSNSMRTFFKTLQNNDVIKIDNIGIYDCDSSTTQLASPVEFTIIKAEDYGVLYKSVEYTPEDTFRNQQTGELFLRILTEDVLTGEIFKDSMEVYQWR